MKTPATPPPLPLMAFTGMLCTLVAVAFARLSYGLVLPFMREGLNLSYSQAANLGTVTALGYVLLLMVAGLFARRYGPRRAILLGLALAVAGFSGMALSSHYLLLLALMTLLGVATAFAYTPLISLLGSWYPERRGTAIGLANGGVGIGMLLSGALAPALSEAFPEWGWRLVWAVFAGTALLTAIMAARIMRDPPASREEEPPETASAGPSVYRNPHVVAVGLVYGVVGLTYIVQTLFMYSFALDAGVASLTAGRLVAAMGLISVFSGPGWGWTADRIGHANALVICMSLSVIATLTPVLWPTTASFTLHYLLLGISVTGLFTSVLASSTATVNASMAPMAVSFVTLFFAVGQLVGPAVAGLLIELRDGFRLIFALTSALMTLGIGFSWLTGSMARRHP